MFDFLGNRKIGVFGAANSGKTLLLTSLLWHLEEHDPHEFVLGNGKVKISDFELSFPSGAHQFPYKAYRNSLVKEGKWPEKTKDFSAITVKYNRYGESWFKSLFSRSVTFVDIPGERTSDVAIWEHADFAEWSDAMFRMWDEDAAVGKSVAKFLDCVRNPVADEATAFETAAREYKFAMRNVIKNFCPVSPSTFFLDCEGKMLTAEELCDDDKLLARPIWSGGEFVPLPPEWKARCPQLYAKVAKTYSEYRRQVIKPLFAEINSCDNFIVCVEVLELLHNGLSAAWENKKTISTFFNKIKPGKFMELFNKVGMNPPRVAFVATKSDMTADRNGLMALLRAHVRGACSTAVETKAFTCSACISTREIATGNGKCAAELACENGERKVVNLPAYTTELPDAWPANNDDVDKYCFAEVSPIVSSGAAPKQSNLDRIFDFITEGI